MTPAEKIEALCAWADANVGILPATIRLSRCETILDTKKMIDRNVSELRNCLEKKNLGNPCVKAYYRLHKLKIWVQNNATK